MQREHRLLVFVAIAGQTHAKPESGPQNLCLDLGPSVVLFCMVSWSTPSLFNPSAGNPPGV
jgi:hypothetical protein